ncbi:MAG: LLM class flavin-dependent oxidoreductase [Candidatus Binatia bacterium]
MFLLRFDMRAPASSPTASADLYQAAIEMAAWAETQGCFLTVICEHHGSPDGYLPSPLTLAAAMAARTTTLPIQIGALLAPLYDPLRLAEDMAVLDIISRGRVSYVLGIGSRPVEYDLLGRSRKARGKRLEEIVAILRSAWTGESFEVDGHPAQVTPRPYSEDGPVMLMGGGTRAAATRAATLDIGLFAQGGGPQLEAFYRAECARFGREPRDCMIPPEGIITSAFVAEDPDRAWRDMGQYLLHDSMMYASWWKESRLASVSRSDATTVDELRAQGGPYAILTPAEAIEYIATNFVLPMQPLCGGMPPALAWRSLELLAERVLPAVAQRAGGT